MFNMPNNLDSFLNWLEGTMRAKNVTQADIARTGLIRSSSVSMLFSRQVKSIGVDMCKAIAAATGTPLETVYRKAGLLPPINLTEEEQEQIAALTANLDPDLRQTALGLLEQLNRQQSARHTAPKNVH